MLRKTRNRRLRNRIIPYVEFIQPPVGGAITGTTNIPGLPLNGDTLAEIVARVEALENAPPPPSQAFERPAGTTLSGHRLVTLDNSGNAVYADYLTQPFVVGLSLNAATSGNTVNIALENTEVEHNGWSFTAGQALFLGANGAITATPPNTGFSAKIGQAVTPTKVFLRFNPIIQLS